MRERSAEGAARVPSTQHLSARFSARVLAVVRRIPPGRVATYGDVAAAAGRPRASRAVGNIMRGCRAPGVPCHRVIAAAGRLGGYGGNLELKRALLRAEGVLVSGTRVKDFDARRWRRTGTPPRKPPPDGRRGLEDSATAEIPREPRAPKTRK